MPARWWGGLVSVTMLAAVLWPLTRDPEREDSFPLSTYPMFAFDRRDARVALHYVVAVGPGGARRHVPPSLVANREPMQAMMTVRRAVEHGQQARLCAEVAGRVAHDGRFAAHDTVTIVFGDHRAIPYLTQGVRGKETVLAQCAVPRSDR
jgi:hypothetical protein